MSQREEIIGDCRLILGDCRDVLPPHRGGLQATRLFAEPPSKPVQPSLLGDAA